jgi:hypothetical protein
VTSQTTRQVCGCLINAKFIDLETCLKVIRHPLRRRILHALSVATLDYPVTKKALAEMLGIPYTMLIFQLNRQLRGFWEVRGERRKRGAREEFIAFAERNGVYISLGANTLIYVLDPIANLFGKLSEGTRCDKCPKEQVEKCLGKVSEHERLNFSPEEKRLLERLLLANGRVRPFTPMDHIITCAILRSFEGLPCAVQVTSDECKFIAEARATYSAFKH